MGYRWTGPVMHTAPTVTGDRRRYAADGGSHRSLPLPLRYSPGGGHNDAVDIGGITSLDLSTNPVQGSGFFLPAAIEPMVTPAMYKMALGINGISAEMEPGTLEFATPTGEEDDQLLDVSKWRVMSAASVSKPAFADTRVGVTDDSIPNMPLEVLVAAAAIQCGWQIEEVDDAWITEQMVLLASVQRESDLETGGGWMEDLNGLLAGGGPLAPSKHYFEDPKLDGPTPVAISADGRITGHIANWGVCHTGVGRACVKAPKSKTGYAKFHQGSVLTSEDEIVRVGKITLGGGHADVKLGIIPAVEHYDNSTTAAAVVRAGEDRHGIWCAGVLVPGVSDERVAELRRSPLSGDWRYDQATKNLELIAALAVNSPGFPIQNVVAGAQMSLVAAGIVVDMAEADEEVEPVEAVLDTDTQTARTERLAAIFAADQARRGDRLRTLFSEE